MGLVSLSDILEKSNPPLDDLSCVEKDRIQETLAEIQSLKPRCPDEPVIYWEFQGKDGMCALHSINNFLQGPIYTEEDLSAVALVLDEKERSLLNYTIDQGAYSDEHKALIQGGSINVSENGFFSYAVIEECLHVQGYSCTSLKSSGLSGATDHLPSNVGLMCNFHEHWFTVRAVGNVWYNLDSIKKSPRELTHAEIQAFFNTVADRHCSVFIISPLLPGQDLPCPEKNALTARLNKNQFLLSRSQIQELVALHNPDRPSANLATPANHTTLFSGEGRSCVGKREDRPKEAAVMPNMLPEDEDDGELRRAIELSLNDYLKRDIVAPPCEPPDTADTSAVLMIRVRLPNESTISRRFWKKDPIKSLCDWIESEPANDFLASRCYSLVALFPRIELRRYNRDSVIHIQTMDSQPLDENLNQPKDQGTAKDVSQQDLKDLFPMSQSLTLHFL